MPRVRSCELARIHTAKAVPEKRRGHVMSHFRIVLIAITITRFLVSFTGNVVGLSLGAEAVECLAISLDSLCVRVRTYTCVCGCMRACAERL